jgi:hypothetical protein
MKMYPLGADLLHTDGRTGRQTEGRTNMTKIIVVRLYDDSLEHTIKYTVLYVYTHYVNAKYAHGIVKSISVDSSTTAE